MLRRSFGLFLVMLVASGHITLNSAASAEVLTPVGNVPKVGGWTAEVLTDQLEHPWAVTFLPDGSMLITERPGRLRVYKDGKLSDPVEGVPEVFARRQGGLLDVTLHPKFEENRWVYLSYSAGTHDANGTRVARGKFDGQKLSDVEVIFDAKPLKRDGFHFGSRLAFMADGSLLVSTGEGAHYRDLAQSVDNHFGKVLRMKDDGSVATGNPFHARIDALPEVWSYGHRNIQGLAIDSSGRVWTTEHGPLGGDELNQPQPGNNYGWPIATYGREYSGKVITDKRTLPGVTDPLVVWVPCIAPSGLCYYTGDKFPQFKGDLLAGGLVSKDIRRVDLEDGKVVAQDRLEIGHRVRDVRQGPDGLIYVVTDEERGQLIRISPEPKKTAGSKQ